MKRVIVITGSVPSECISIRRMTEVKWSQSSGPRPRGMLRRGALKDRHFAGDRLLGKWPAQRSLMAVVANQAVAFDKSILDGLSPSRRCAPSGVDPGKPEVISSLVWLVPTNALAVIVVLLARRRLEVTNPPKTGSDRFRITDDPVAKDGVLPICKRIRTSTSSRPRGITS